MPTVWRYAWKDLSEDEKLSAEFLDYDEFTWNGCAGSGLVTTTPPPLTQHADPFRRIRAQLYMPRSYNEVMSIKPTLPPTTTPDPEQSTTTTTTTMEPGFANLLAARSGGSAAEKVEEQTGGFAQVAQEAIARTLFCNNP